MLFIVRGIKCKAKSLRNGQFLEGTLSISIQKLAKSLTSLGSSPRGRGITVPHFLPMPCT